MVESYLATCRVWAGAAWAVVAVFMVGAWSVVIFDQQHWLTGLMLGLTGLVVSAGAAVLHIRSFMVRMCALIRAAHRTDLSSGEAQELGLHPVR